MIIAILLCMAFVVNVGATFAITNYEFSASSVNSSVTTQGSTTTNYDSYTNFASMDSAVAKYTYSAGTYNNQLSINYGFNTVYNYDIMVRFTASYTDKGATNESTHIANDFTINFVNRDDWCIDMGSINGWKISNSALVADPTQNYYTTTSATGTISGVMYYMGTKTGSGSLPIISSVTFHTSPNNSYEYIGDELTITLTPEFVISNSNNYTTNHDFYSTSSVNGFTQNQTIFNNWASYMRTKGDGTTASETSYMIYNAYVDDSRSLEFPYDDSVITNTGIVDSSVSAQPNYSNTAYRYEINTTTDEDDVITTTRTYDAITAGNKYYGGLGVYVIPSSSLVTISVSFSYYWQNNMALAGTTNSEMVRFEYSDQIQTISNNGTNHNYYRADINKPTYIDVLEYIMFTAEESKPIISGKYSLIISNISVGLVNSSNDILKDDVNTTNVWTGSYSKPNYEIHNSTISSPILARVKDIVTGSESYEADISITNNNTTPLAIRGFTISSELWYGSYTTTAGVTKFSKQNFTVTENEVTTTVYVGASALKYDTELWNLSYSNGIFTFTIKSEKSVYIPSGYSLSLINGVEIPQIQACQVDGKANDFWCSLDVTSVTTSIASISYANTSISGVETIVEGYYQAISSTTPGKIYIRNNTCQAITAVALDEVTLSVRELNGDSDYLPRDQVGDTATYTITKHLPSTVSIKPGELVLAYTITPETTSIIYKYDITATLSAGIENKDIDLIYSESNQSGSLINNSNKYYEFRLESPTDISNLLAYDNDFVEREVSVTQDEVTTTMFYYYYKGILCPHRCIEVFTGFASNVKVNYLVHLTTNSSNYYIASNYTQWGLDDTNDATWLNFMKALYNAPSNNDRVNADIITPIYKVFTYDTAYAITPVGATNCNVVKGTNFTFTISLASGYEFGNTVVVKANGTELTANNGQYTINSVTKDVEIEVTGIQQIVTE